MAVTTAGIKYISEADNSFLKLSGADATAT